MFSKENFKDVTPSFQVKPTKLKGQESLCVSMDCNLRCQVGTILAFASVVIIGSVLTGLLVKYAKERPLIQQTLTLFLTTDSYLCFIAFPIASFLVIIFYVTIWNDNLSFALASSFALTLMEFFSSTLLLITSILMYLMLMQSDGVPICWLLTGNDEVDHKRVCILSLAISSCVMLLFYSYSFYPMLLYDLLDDESQVPPRTFLLPIIYIGLIISIVGVYFVIHLKMEKMNAGADIHLVNLHQLPDSVGIDPDDGSLQCKVKIDSVPFSALSSALSGSIFLANLILFDLGFGKDFLPKFWLVFLRLLFKSIISSISGAIAMLIGQKEIREYYMKQLRLFLDVMSDTFNNIANLISRHNSVSPA